jgi:hypothetical protein
MGFQTTVGQLAVVGGRPYERAEGLLLEERASRTGRGQRKSNLYVLIEMEGQVGGRDVLAERLAEIIRDSFFRERKSVTAALLQAVRSANGYLLKENQNSITTERRGAGVSCAVLHGEDLFIAQAGPAALYLAQQEQTIRFPEFSPWLDNVPQEEVDAAPLGTRPEVRVDLFHRPLADGDTILLVDSRLARQVHPQSWHSILTTAPLNAALGELLHEGRGGDLRAMVVRVAKEGSRGSPALAPVGTQASYPARRKGQPRSPRESKPMGGVLAALSAATLAFAGRLAPGPPSNQQSQSGQPPPAREPKRRSRRSPRTEARKPLGSFLQKLLLGIAIAIPLIVAIVVGLTVVQRDQARSAKVEGQWQQANQLWAQAEAADDPVAVRTLLLEADGQLSELLAEQPEHSGALALRAQVEARLAEGSQVRPIHWEGRLASYPQSAHLTRVVVQGLDVFVMDRSADVVYHHQLDELQQALLPDTQQEVLVRKGEQVGDILVGDLVDMTWMPVGSGRQKAALLILESNGVLLEYDPNTKLIAPLRLAGQEMWQLPHLVGSHSGRFYLLDLGANQILRYGPTAEGYSSPPDPWLQNELDLAGIQDMAVGDSIYLLYADGKIRKLTGGQPDTFDPFDWDIPPVGPTALFTRPPKDTQWVYVADTGNSRIVRSSKEGRFGGQYLLADAQGAGSNDPLANVTSLYVDEIGGRAYFLAENSLYMIILPGE